MTKEPILTLEQVTVGYERKAVLGGISFALERGSFTGLLGSNGSGKSTLIKTIIGVIPPLEGKLAFQMADGRRPMLGYVPQREALDPIFILSSFEVALMGVCGRVGAGRVIRSAEIEWVNHCLEETGAADLAKKPFSQLSGGQKQRVLIARALAAKPDFLLLDEPTAGIDTAATQAIMELLKRIHEQQGMTILMVNHDLAAVRRYAQRVIWLNQGKVLQGPVAELLSRERIEAILDLQLH